MNLEVCQFLKESFVALAIAASPQASGTRVPSHWLTALGCHCNSSRPLPHGTGVPRRHPQQGQQSSSHGFPLWLGQCQVQALSAWEARGQRKLHPSFQKSSRRKALRGPRMLDRRPFDGAVGLRSLLREPAVPRAFATVQTWPLHGLNESSVFCLRIMSEREPCHVGGRHLRTAL